LVIHEKGYKRKILGRGRGNSQKRKDGCQILKEVGKGIPIPKLDAEEVERKKGQTRRKKKKKKKRGGSHYLLLIVSEVLKGLKKEGEHKNV